jgi:DUF1680 family protein
MKLEIGVASPQRFTLHLRVPTWCEGWSVALERGPIVYCLEGVDHAGILLDRIAIDPQDASKEFQVEQDENLLGGISLLRGKGTIVDESGWDNVLYRNQVPSSKSVNLTAIPYYAWENRAPGEMRIWLQARGG